MASERRSKWSIWATALSVNVRKWAFAVGPLFRPIAVLPVSGIAIVGGGAGWRKLGVSGTAAFSLFVASAGVGCYLVQEVTRGSRLSGRS